MDKSLLPRIEEYLAAHRQEMVDNLKALVSIPSVSQEAGGAHPFGDGCAQVLDKALEIARAKGLTTTNHDYYYGTACYGQGDKTIGVFAHLDVVPEGNDWMYAPYQPVEKDGWLIGRGSADNKSAAIAGIYIAHCLQTLGLPLRSRISLFLGCNEEKGMQDIERYAKEQPMPDFSIVPDTHFPVCHGEKGILEADFRCPTPFTTITGFQGGLASNMVPDRATATLACDEATAQAALDHAAAHSDIAASYNDGLLTFTATGVSAHAAYPTGSRSAIGMLARLLLDCPGVSESDRATMAFVAKTLSDNHGQAMGIAFSDEPSGKLTCISGLARLVDGCLELNFNIRYPVTHKGELVIAGICGYFAALGWQETGCHDSGPAYLPKDDPKVVQLCDIYHQLTGKDATPYVMGGGTYSRHLRNAIGFGMESDRETPLPAGHGGVHQPDEALYIDDMLEAIKIYVMSMLEIDQVLHS